MEYTPTLCLGVQVAVIGVTVRSFPSCQTRLGLLNRSHSPLVGALKSGHSRAQQQSN